MTDFHEVRFPENISFGSTGGPVRLTEVTTLRSGYEQRNSVWVDSKRRYNVGSGIKSLDDIHTIIAFFEARMGRLYGFRYKDYSDYKSCAPNDKISCTDQILGTGDGTQCTFPFCKKYASSSYSWIRTIVKPVQNTVVIALSNQVQSSDYSIDENTGTVTFRTPPENGVVVTAGFEFDVPVRFDTDELLINFENFNAGIVPNIKLTEIRL